LVRGEKVYAENLDRLKRLSRELVLEDLDPPWSVEDIAGALFHCPRYCDLVGVVFSRFPNGIVLPEAKNKRLSFVSNSELAFKALFSSEAPWSSPLQAILRVAIKRAEDLSKTERERLMRIQDSGEVELLSVYLGFGAVQWNTQGDTPILKTQKSAFQRGVGYGVQVGPLYSLKRRGRSRFEMSLEYQVFSSSTALLTDPIESVASGKLERTVTGIPMRWILSGWHLASYVGQDVSKISIDPELPGAFSVTRTDLMLFAGSGTSYREYSGEVWIGTNLLSTIQDSQKLRSSPITSSRFDVRMRLRSATFKVLGLTLRAMAEGRVSTRSEQSSASDLLPSGTSVGVRHTETSGSLSLSYGELR
jgi:hypothetical protein